MEAQFYTKEMRPLHWTTPTVFDISVSADQLPVHTVAWAQHSAAYKPA